MRVPRTDREPTARTTARATATKKARPPQGDRAFFCGPRPSEDDRGARARLFVVDRAEVDRTLVVLRFLARASARLRETIRAHADALLAELLVAAVAVEAFADLEERDRKATVN